MMPKLIDTHSHINFNAYKDDADAVIKRAFDNNVKMFAVGSQLSSSQRAVQYAEKYNGIWAIVGLHPIHLQEMDYHDDSELGFKTRQEEFDYGAYKKLASHPKVVAIGECGLDYYRINDIPADNDFIQFEQKRIFIRQLSLAQELNLPLAIHCRDAYEDLLKVIKDFIAHGNKTPRAVMHCFLGDEGLAQEFMALGFYLSFTGIITFPKTEYLTQIVRKTPLERILVETDCPYLTPRPHRGKRNEPAYVRYVAEKIAEIKGVSAAEVAAVTYQNTKDLFKIC